MILFAFLNVFLGILLLFVSALIYLNKDAKLFNIPIKPKPNHHSKPIKNNSHSAPVDFSFLDDTVYSYMEYDPYAPGAQDQDQDVVEQPDNCSDNTYCGPPYTRPQEICNKNTSNNEGCTKFISFSHGSNIENKVGLVRFLQGATKVEFWKELNYNGESHIFTCDYSPEKEYINTCFVEGIYLDEKNYKSAKVIEDGANGYPKGVGVVAIFNLNNQTTPFIFREAEHFDWYIDKAELTITNNNTVDLKYVNIQVYNSDGTIDNSEENLGGFNSELIKSLIEQDIDPSEISLLWNESILNGSQNNLSTTENVELRLYEDKTSNINNAKQTYNSSNNYLKIKEDNEYKKLFVFNKISTDHNDLLFRF